MLVCNVSMRPPRRTIAADLAETGAAADSPGTGNIIFATLVDDPASVGDILDAYLGEIMLEAASAADDVTAGMAYAAAIDATVTAIDAPDGTVTAAPTTTTWNPADKTASMTLTGGNLIATNTGGATSVVRSVAGQSSGKFYFEITNNAGGGSTWFGIANSSVPLTSWVSNATGGAALHVGGAIYVNFNGTGISFASVPNASVISIAVDLVNQRIWFRVSGGNWNNSGTANPATNTGGIDISSVFTGVAAYACYAAGNINNNGTANFGATSFAYTVPSGFSAGPT
jgi:hypothetical protein